MVKYIICANCIEYLYNNHYCKLNLVSFYFDLNVPTQYSLPI